MSATDRTRSEAILTTEQELANCENIGDISTTPELKTEDGNIDVSAQKDVRFRRVVNNDVSIFELNEKVDSLQSSLQNQVKDAVAQITAAHDGASTQYVDTSIKGLDGKVDAIVAGWDGKLEAAVAGLQGTTTAVKDMIQAVINAQVDAAVKGLQIQVAGMVADEVKTLENSLAVITTSLNTAHDDIADLKQANAQLAKEIAMLKEVDVTHDARISDAEKTLDDIAKEDVAGMVSTVVSALENTHYMDPSVPILYACSFHTYQHSSSWFMGNAATLFGGINPKTWTDGNGMAQNINSQFRYLQSIFKTKTTGSKIGGLNLCTDVYIMYSSTDGHVCGGVFRIKNTKTAPINWSVSFWYTAFAGWGERASATINGQSSWNSGGTNVGGIAQASVSFSVPGSRTSTVIFVVTGNVNVGLQGNMHERAVVLAFNELTLPTGLEYADDLEVQVGTDNWQQK